MLFILFGTFADMMLPDFRETWQSRFSLFMAALLPAGVALALAFSAPGDMVRLRIEIDAIIALGSLLLLWRVAHSPSI